VEVLDAASMPACEAMFLRFWDAFERGRLWSLWRFGSSGAGDVWVRERDLPCGMAGVLRRAAAKGFMESPSKAFLAGVVERFRLRLLYDSVRVRHDRHMEPSARRDC
jgi:sugar phosphate permease